MENMLYEAIEKAKKYDELTFIFKDKVLHCSFCNKPQHEVEKLIAGPNAYICNECVSLCNEVLEGQSDSKERKDD